MATAAKAATAADAEAAAAVRALADREARRAGGTRLGALRDLWADLAPLAEEAPEATAVGDTQRAALLRLRLELAWQRLFELAQAYAAGAALVEERAAKSVPGHECRASMLRQFVGTARLKCDALRAELEAGLYGPDGDGSVMRQLGEQLAARRSAVDEEVAELEARLERLAQLPLGLVDEYAKLQGRIQEKREYIRRLEQK